MTRTGINFQFSLKLCHEVYSNDYPGFGVTYSMARSSLLPNEWLNTKPNFMQTLFGTGGQNFVQMVRVFDHDGRHAHMNHVMKTLHFVVTS